MHSFNYMIVRFYNCFIVFKSLASGEARTLDLRNSMSALTDKYDALTDCATGAW